MTKRVRYTLMLLGAGVALMNVGVALMGGLGPTLVLDGLLFVSGGVYVAVNYS